MINDLNQLWSKYNIAMSALTERLTGAGCLDMHYSEQIVMNYFHGKALKTSTAGVVQYESSLYQIVTHRMVTGELPQIHIATDIKASYLFVIVLSAFGEVLSASIAPTNLIKSDLGIEDTRSGFYTITLNNNFHSFRQTKDVSHSIKRISRDGLDNHPTKIDLKVANGVCP